MREGMGAWEHGATKGKALNAICTAVRDAVGQIKCCTAKQSGIGKRGDDEGGRGAHDSRATCKGPDRKTPRERGRKPAMAYMP